MLGIEEEYLLVDVEIGVLVEVFDVLMVVCKVDFGD